MTTRECADLIISDMGGSWLPNLYRDRVKKMRTRSFEFEETTQNAAVSIQHTLLGVELKVCNRRMLCPDLATARYLAVFAKAGCKDVAVPYDITKVSQLADELESSWYRMLLLVDHHAVSKTAAFRSKVRGLLIARVRETVATLGAGEKMPEFKQSTRQRR